MRENHVKTAQSANVTGSPGLAASIRTVFGYCLSGALLVLILRSIDLSESLNHARRIPLWAIAATAAIGYCSIPLRIIQWRWLLGWPAKATNAKTFKALSLGYLGNAVLPMRGGEFLKSFLLGKSTGIRFGRVFSTVVIERFQDLLPIFILAALAALLIPVSSDIEIDAGGSLSRPLHIGQTEVTAALRLIGIGSMVAIMLLLALTFGYRKAANLVSRASLRLLGERTTDKIQKRLRQLDFGATTPQALAGSQLIALGCWLLFLLAPIPLLMAFSLTFPQACLTALAINGLATFAHLLPSAPGAVGTFDAVSLFAIMLCNPSIEPERAVAITFLAHAIGILAPAVPGLILLPSAWTELREARRTQGKANDVQTIQA